MYINLPVKIKHSIKMKSENSAELIYKDVVVIGNGPSGIALSYMLSGNVPYIKSCEHPDEMLSARLSSTSDTCLINSDLEYLSSGLEGRSINPVSLLMDTLLHPYADMGLEVDPLVEFRKNGKEIDHIVLGKGPPGGSWHKMDPNILTLSLGSWMSLPGLPLDCRDSGENRVFASTVANYYTMYVKEMNLSKYFQNYVVVKNVSPVINNQKLHVNLDNRRNIERINSDHDIKSKTKKCLISNAFQYILGRNKKLQNRCSKRPRDLINDQSPDKKIREIIENESTSLKYFKHSDKSLSRTSESFLIYDIDKNVDNSFQMNAVPKNAQNNKFVPSVSQQAKNKDINWLVETEDLITGRKCTYVCSDLVLANGCSDLPNKLTFSNNKDPSWLFHDLRSLELELEKITIEGTKNDSLDPIVVVGAGLSAADGIIAIRGKNIPVVHVFRNESGDLNKQLPEKMYPEYHKVHQMMQDGGSSYPLYKSYPGHSLIHLNGEDRTVTLSSSRGNNVEIKVSYVIVLIGSRPDLSFLPIFDSAAKKNLSVDAKSNNVNIDKLTHKVEDLNHLYAVGTLAGDNFVRFIPGGALAVVADLYKTYNYKM